VTADLQSAVGYTARTILKLAAMAGFAPARPGSEPGMLLLHHTAVEMDQTEFTELNRIPPQQFCKFC
jgi:hypothetical protein